MQDTVTVALGQRPAVPPRAAEFVVENGRTVHKLPVEGRPAGPRAVAVTVFADGKAVTAYLSADDAIRLHEQAAAAAETLIQETSQARAQ